MLIEDDENNILRKIAIDLRFSGRGWVGVKAELGSHPVGVFR